ncbi:MAG: nucleotidyl transferase AbiEii/AbiGii toxin family protein [Anaerolineae bacterium]
MISEAEVRRAAGTWGIDPMIVDLDYVLGCFLSQWSKEKTVAGMLFKGGTCLRKCYFPEYRFSEDLDFTAIEEVTLESAETGARSVVQRVQDVFALDLSAAPLTVRTIRDSSGEISIDVRVYYRGPLRRTGAPRAIRVHLSTGEFVGLPPSNRALLHSYGDKELIENARIACYDLREIAAEKLRAVCGQRQFAISRDVYDLHQLVAHKGISLEDVSGILAPKFEARGLALEVVDPVAFAARRDGYQRDWSRNLAHLLPSLEEPSFEEAWETAVELVSWVASLAG